MPGARAEARAFLKVERQSSLEDPALQPSEVSVEQPPIVPAEEPGIQSLLRGQISVRGKRLQLGRRPAQERCGRLPDAEAPADGKILYLPDALGGDPIVIG
jgi:hypothetical protein